MEWRKKGKTDLEIKQQQRNEVLVRSIIKEAEYLMRCGRLYQAISSINRVLTNLPHYGLEIIDLANLLDPLHEVGSKKNCLKSSQKCLIVYLSIGLGS